MELISTSIKGMWETETNGTDTKGMLYRIYAQRNKGGVHNSLREGVITVTRIIPGSIY